MTMTATPGIADELSAFANKPAPRPGVLNPPCDPEIWHPPSSTAFSGSTAAPSSPHPYSLPRPLDGNSPPQRDHFINYRIRPGLSNTRSGSGHTCSALTWLFKTQALSVIALPWPLNPWSYCRRLLPGRQHDEKTLSRSTGPSA